MGILETKIIEAALVRSRILDAIQMRVKTMRDGELKGAYRDMQELVKRITPHWTSYNAIVGEMEKSYNKGEELEKIIAMAMRRLQDGLLFQRWLGMKL